MTTFETHESQRLVARAGFTRSALEREARDLTTPGVISIVEDASLTQVHRALAAHQVHALLAVGQRSGRLLVQRHVEALPQGVISELDLVVGPRD